METKQNLEKTSTTRKIVTIVIALVVLAALFLAAQYIVSSVDIVELLKKMVPIRLVGDWQE